jgi:mRNA interferase RelE/StbE
MVECLFFFVNNPLAFVYTIVYHIYTFLFVHYGNPHDQHPQISGEYAKSPQRGSGQKYALRGYAPFDSDCESYPLAGRSRRTREASGEREEGRTPRQDVHDGRGSQRVGSQKIIWTLEAKEELKRLSALTSDRIWDKIYWFASQEDPFTFARPLHDTQLASHRFRVGDYRILFERHPYLPQTLLILAVRHRSKAYE